MKTVKKLWDFAMILGNIYVHRYSCVVTTLTDVNMWKSINIENTDRQFGAIANGIPMKLLKIILLVEGYTYNNVCM